MTQKIIVGLILLCVGALLYDRLVQRIELPFKLTQPDPTPAVEQAQAPSAPVMPPSPPAAPAKPVATPIEVYQQYINVAANAKQLEQLAIFFEPGVFTTMMESDHTKTLSLFKTVAQLTMKMDLKVADQFEQGPEAILKLSPPETDGKEEKKSSPPKMDVYIHFIKAGGRWMIVKQVPETGPTRKKYSAKEFLEVAKKQ